MSPEVRSVYLDIPKVFGKFLHLQNSLGSKYQIKLTILIYENKFARKRIFKVEIRKNELDYFILHIRISVGTKF